MNNFSLLICNLWNKRTGHVFRYKSHIKFPLFTPTLPLSLTQGTLSIKQYSFQWCYIPSCPRTYVHIFPLLNTSSDLSNTELWFLSLKTILANKFEKVIYVCVFILCVFIVCVWKPVVPSASWRVRLCIQELRENQRPSRPIVTRIQLATLSIIWPS